MITIKLDLAVIANNPYEKELSLVGSDENNNPITVKLDWKGRKMLEGYFRDGFKFEQERQVQLK